MTHSLPFDVEARWAVAHWLYGETQMEEARRRERNGDGEVIDDGHPPARWVPKAKGRDDAKA